MTSMVVYYLAVVVVVLGSVGLRHAVRTAIARQAERDAAALAKAKFGRKYNTPEMGQPHDQRKAEIAHVVATRTDRRHRKVAASRAVAPSKPVAQPKVTPMRRAK
jgi:hypothetical protein